MGYHDGDFPVTEQLSGRLLRLPFHPTLTEEDQERVAHSIGSFFNVTRTRKIFTTGRLVESA